MGKLKQIRNQTLLDHVKLEENGCWIWKGSLQTHGYAYLPWRLYHEKFKTTLGHRIYFMVFRGPIPKGMEIDHLCNVKACVNPYHLEVVTHEENNRRRNAEVDARRKVFPCGHPRVGGHTYMKRAGYYKSGKIKLTKVCRPCYLAYSRKRNNVRRKQLI